jgi:hypothetical protein
MNGQLAVGLFLNGYSVCIQAKELLVVQGLLVVVAMLSKGE